MKIFALSNAQQAQLGFTHRFEILYSDLTTASTAHTQTLAAYTAGKGVTAAAFRLVSGFVGASVTNLTMAVGFDGATTDDADGIIEAVELATAGTEINYGDATGAIFAAKRTGYFPQDAGNYTALFTATGANVTVLTAGEVHVYLRLVDLATG